MQSEAALLLVTSWVGYIAAGNGAKPCCALHLQNKHSLTACYVTPLQISIPQVVHRLQPYGECMQLWAFRLGPYPWHQEHMLVCLTGAHAPVQVLIWQAVEASATYDVVMLPAAVRRLAWHQAQCVLHRRLRELAGQIEASGQSIVEAATQTEKSRQHRRAVAALNDFCNALWESAAQPE